MDGWINIGTKIDTNSFDAQIDYIEQRMEEIEYKLEQADKGFDVGDTTKLEAEYEKLGNQLTKLIAKQKELNNAQSESPEIVGDIGKSMSGTIKKVSRWALAIFGVRTAYMGIRQAISYVSQYNEQLAAQLESIKYTLAMALEPVVVAIVNWVYKLIQYVNYLAEAWFNVNLFANANTKAMNKAASAAKEMKKSLSGFDTANVLSDTSTSSTSNPSAMAELPQSEIPDWLVWIKDNGPLIAGIIAGITAAIIALKLGIGGLTSLGIGLILAGIVALIGDIVKFIEDPSWDNFINILRDLAIVLAGVAVAMLAVNAANPVAWIMLAIAAVVLLATTVIKHWDTIKGVLGTVGNWIYKNIITPVANFFSGLWNGIKTGVSTAITSVKSAFSGVVTFFSGIVNGILNLFKKIGTNVGNVVSSAFKGVVNGVLSAIESILNTPIKAINGLIKTINKVPGINLSKLSTFSLPRLATGGIVNNPGRGVPIGGAIAGEAGREGVLPLTDSTTMAQLGQEIGKWISVNVDLTTKLDSRVLSRSLEKVQSNNSFVRNGV